MKDKVIIITGGSSGIGKALAYEFGKNGSRIVITGRRQEELDKALQDFSASSIEALAIRADVTQPKDNQRMVELTLERFGRIDGLVNNAGISMRALFEEVDVEVIRKLMEINFFGVLYATKACLPEIIKNKGSIIGISSIAGYRGLPARTGYSASKFALNGFLEALRTELLMKEVHVLTACPGFTATSIRKHSLLKDGREQGESPRAEEKMMTAEECARHIYRAALRKKKTLVLTRQGKLTVFLNKWASGWIDKSVYKVLAKESDSPLR